jgi:hypothetical protein
MDFPAVRLQSQPGGLFLAGGRPVLPWNDGLLLAAAGVIFDFR